MRRIHFAAVLATALGLTAGCQNGSKTLQLGLSATTGATPSSGATLAIDGGNSISIDRVQLVIARAELEGPAACATGTGTTAAAMSGRGVPAGVMFDQGGGPGDGHDGHDGEDGVGETHDCEVEGGPFLIDLSGDTLAGGVHEVAGFTVATGTYEELKLWFSPITTAQAGSDTGLQALATAGASVQVDGTLAGVAFTFSAPLEAMQKREGTITVDPSTGANVTLDVDPSGWFKAHDGSRLDPTDPAMQAAILENVRASLRVLKDDNHDGVDDDAQDTTAANPGAGGDDGSGGNASPGDGTGSSGSDASM
jgi:hypothetical protein